MSSNKVCIAHSGRQHAHQTAYALQEGKMLQTFFTTLWYKPSVFPYSFLRKLSPSIRSILEKRYFEKIDPDLVEQIPFRELQLQLIRLVSEDWYGTHIYQVNIDFDKKVSRELDNRSIEAFIGYETSCLNSFQYCRQTGVLAFLDLAQVHHKAHRILIEAGIDPFWGDSELNLRINERKDRELQLADRIFVPSSFSQRSLVDAGIAPEKIVRIPYGFDPETYHPSPISDRPQKFQAIFAGSMTKRKGVHLLLKAWTELKLPNAELILVGGISDARNDLAQYEGSFTYVPFVSSKQLAEFFRQSDVFILPSLMDSFGIVVLEAMACATAVIVTKSTGACDLVRDGVDGFVIEDLNMDTLKEKILFLYRNRELSKQMGVHAFEQSSSFTWARYRQQVRDSILSGIYGSKLAPGVVSG